MSNGDYRKLLILGYSCNLLALYSYQKYDGGKKLQEEAENCTA